MNSEHDKELSALYQSGEETRSPKSLDDKILAQAKAHADSVRQPFFLRPQFYAMSASTCVLVLAVSFVFNSPKPESFGPASSALQSAPRLMQKTPEVSRMKVAPEAARMGAAPEVTRMEAAPEVARMEEASAVARMEEAPEATQMEAESDAAMVVEERATARTADKQNTTQTMGLMSVTKKRSPEPQTAATFSADAGTAAPPFHSDDLLEEIDLLIAQGKHEEAKQALTTLLEAMPHLSKDDGVLERQNTLQMQTDE